MVPSALGHVREGSGFRSLFDIQRLRGEARELRPRDLRVGREEPVAHAEYALVCRHVLYGFARPFRLREVGEACARRREGRFVLVYAHDEAVVRTRASASAGRCSARARRIARARRVRISGRFTRVRDPFDRHRFACVRIAYIAHGLARSVHGIDRAVNQSDRVFRVARVGEYEISHIDLAVAAVFVCVREEPDPCDAVLRRARRQGPGQVRRELKPREREAVCRMGKADFRARDGARYVYGHGDAHFRLPLRDIERKRGYGREQDRKQQERRDPRRPCLFLHNSSLPCRHAKAMPLSRIAFAVSVLICVACFDQFAALTPLYISIRSPMSILSSAFLSALAALSSHKAESLVSLK